MFEKATKVKLRFESPMGLLSVEDVWDLPLTGGRFNLDSLAKALNKEVKNSEEESFVVKKKNVVGESLALRFDIVKHIISVRLAEKDAATEAKQKRERKQKLAALIAEKEDQSLSNLSIDELKALAAEE